MITTQGRLDIIPKHVFRTFLFGLLEFLEHHRKTRSRLLEENGLILWQPIRKKVNLTNLDPTPKCNSQNCLSFRKQFLD